MKLRATGELTLVAATLAHLRIELESPGELAALLGADVSPSWPTGEYDRDAMAFFRDRLQEGGEAAAGWYGWYALREPDATAPRTLVGSGGYFGPPDPDGTVEIGYSVLPAWQRRGYASATVEALVANAFAHPQVERVIAHTTAGNPASIAVLLRCGFRRAGSGGTERPGTEQFVRVRSGGTIPLG